MKHFKSSQSPTTSSATNALQDLNIDEDDLSDDYDFMDDVADDSRVQERLSRKQAQLQKKKYMEILQRVADRLESEITIELDDLAVVRDFHGGSWMEFDAYS